MEDTERTDVVESSLPVADDELVHVAHHDVAEQGLSVTLSLALSEVAGLPATDLVSRFGDHVDPDALDRLFRPLPNGDLREGGPLHLSIEGYAVEVYNTGRIEIHEVQSRR